MKKLLTCYYEKFMVFRYFLGRNEMSLKEKENLADFKKVDVFDYLFLKLYESKQEFMTKLEDFMRSDIISIVRKRLQQGTEWGA